LAPAPPKMALVARMMPIDRSAAVNSTVIATAVPATKA
jgi:hypothetical protein